MSECGKWRALQGVASKYTHIYLHTDNVCGMRAWAPIFKLHINNSQSVSELKGAKHYVSRRVQQKIDNESAKIKIQIENTYLLLSTVCIRVSHKLTYRMA